MGSPPRKRLSVPILRNMIYGFVILFIIVSVATLAMGILMYKEMSNFSIFFGFFMVLPVSLSICGTLAIIAAYLGYLAAKKVDYDSSILFARATSVISAFEVLLAVPSALYFMTFYPRVLENTMLELIQDPSDLESDSYKEMLQHWYPLQTMVKCCGALSPSDWHLSKLRRETEYLPSSCCIDPETKCDYLDFTYMHIIGCRTAFLDEAMKDLLILLGVGLGFGFFDVAGLVLACKLIVAMRLVQNTGKDKNIPKISITM